MRYSASEKAEIIQLVEHICRQAARWTSWASPAPRFTAGMTFTVREAPRHWTIGVHDYSIS